MEKIYNFIIFFKTTLNVTVYIVTWKKRLQIHSGPEAVNPVNRHIYLSNTFSMIFIYVDNVETVNTILHLRTFMHLASS